MSGLIEHENNENTAVIIGDEQSQISLKNYQNIYHQITGRTEKIRQKYPDNLLIDFNEIEQLHFKLMQLCDIHKIIASNEIVSVFHEKERKEQFTSFERFKAYNTNATSPTVNIVFRYNFSIIPAEIKQPQEYIITIRLNSRVAMFEKIKAEAPPFMRNQIINFTSNNIAEISVEYSDYIIARSFLESFDEWIKGCKSTPKNKWLDLIQEYSYLLPKLIQFCLATIFIYFSFNSIPNIFQATNTPETLARFITIFGGGLFMIIILAKSAGNMIENAIDSIPQLSYLKLNKGDIKLIDDFGKQNKSTKTRFIISCLLTIILGIISSKISLLI